MKIRHWKYLTRPRAAMKMLLQKWFGIPFSRWLVNFLFQRIFRLNADVPFQVNYTSSIGAGEGIVIGKNVWKSCALSGGCYIQGGNGVYIGDDTIFAPGVKIISANHARGGNQYWESAPPIRIGKRCWIATNAVILPGVELGDDCIVGAGAVVTKSFPGGSVIGGVPAKLLLAVQEAWRDNYK